MNVEAVLTELGGRIEFPAEPNLALSVGRRLRAAPAPRRAPLWARTRVLAAAACVAIALVFTVSSGARDAVASLLGLDGVSLHFADTLPQVEPTVEGEADRIVPGRYVTLELAEAAAGFDVKVPAVLGMPDEVYMVADIEEAELVSLVYYPAPGLPESEQTGVGAVLSEFQGSFDVPFLDKILQAGGTTLEPIEIDGREAYFISGVEHVVSYLDPDGEPRQLPARLAGNTLLWDGGGVIYRLEADVDLERALQIADSLP